jgi:DNA-binding XRE family transcriptional regulator
LKLRSKASLSEPRTLRRILLHVLAAGFAQVFGRCFSKPNPIDVLVGENIRARGLADNMSQQALARSQGVSYQQIQKSEKGINRVGTGQLRQIAEVFPVPIFELFRHDG